MTRNIRTPAAQGAPEETRMTADLPHARVEIAHRADAETGEEILTVSLRAQPSIDAALGLFGPAAMASLMSAGAPALPAFGAREAPGGWAFSAGADPMTAWGAMWSQWLTLWMRPMALFGGAPTICAPFGPPPRKDG